MADKKITQLNELIEADSLDVFAIVDLTGVDETKKITVGNLMATPGPIGASNPDTGTFTVLELASGEAVNNISDDEDLGNNTDVIPTQNAVKVYVDNKIDEVSSSIVNPRNVYYDTTGVSGDIILVDTTNGDVEIELLIEPRGKVTIKKISEDSNIVNIVTNSGLIDGVLTKEIDTLNESLSFVTNTNNFYII